MESIRITKTMKDQLTRAVFKYRYSGKNDPFIPIVKRQAALVDAIYRQVLGKDYDQIQKLPAGWLPEKEHFGIQFGSEYAWLYFDGEDVRSMLSYELRGGHRNNRYGVLPEEYWPGLERPKRRIPEMYQTRAAHTYEHDHEFTKEFSAIRKAVDVIAEEMKSALLSINAVFKQAQTTKQLLELWPEIEPFLAEVLGDKAKKARLVPVKDLNKIFKLPKEKVAA